MMQTSYAAGQPELRPKYGRKGAALYHIISHYITPYRACVRSTKYEVFCLLRSSQPGMQTSYASSIFTSSYILA